MQSTQIYTASAGSGKTFTLVKEYLKILFSHGHQGNFKVYRKILAITFTNKATAEMKERILKELIAIARGNDSDLLGILKKELAYIDSFKAIAKQIVTNLLHDYSNFNVQTIDSFFQQIVRSFAKELDIPINFEIEFNQDDVLALAVDDLIDQIGGDKVLSKWLTAYSISNINEDKSWDFKSNMLAISKEVFKQGFSSKDYSFDINALEKVRKKILSGIKEFESSYKLKAEACLSILNKIDYPDEGFSRKGIPNWLNKLTGQISLDKIIPSPTVSAQITGDNLYHSKTFAKQNIDSIAALEATSFFKDLHELYDYLQINIGDYIINKEIKKSIFSLGVIYKIDQYVKEYRTEQNVLFISDTLSLINGFIQLDDMPFLFEKLANKIDYLFLDEFQDTSTMQWDNLLPMILNILSSVDQRNLHVMIVGDAKQSIYRWRNGDFELLTHKAKAMLHPFPTEEISLTTNYRSLPEIINFNNDFFEQAIDVAKLHEDKQLAIDLKLIYNDVRQEQSIKSPEGFTSVNFISQADGEDWMDKSQIKLLKDIEQLREKGYTLSDMTILVRRKQEGVRVSRYLQNNGVNILSEETLLLKYNTAVKLTVAALYYIEDPDQPLNYINLVWQLYSWLPNQNISKAELFKDHEERKHLAELFPEHLELHKDYLGLYAAIELVNKLFKIDISTNLFAYHFKQLAFDYIKNNSNDIGDFLSYWEDKRDALSVSLDTGIDRINIMTIHKSKGLEFPVVFLPFCNWGYYHKFHENYIWKTHESIDSNLIFPIRLIKELKITTKAEHFLKEQRLTWIDNLNILYVAFTRAKEVLAITTTWESNTSSSFPKASGLLIKGILDRMTKPISDPTEDTTITFGSLTNLPVQKNKNEHSATVSTLPASTMNHVKIEFTKDFDNSGTRIGNLVHQALFYLANNNAVISFEKACKEASFTTDEIEIAKVHFEKITSSDSLFSTWVKTAKKTWNEQSIYYNGDNYRPDKVFQLEDRFVVVDYKTGQLSKGHQRQVKKYMEALSAQGIEEPIEGYVLYTEDANLVAVE